MQAAANRSAAPSGVRPAAQNEDYNVRALEDDGALLDALPIAAGVFGLKQKKLWVHSLNRKFFDLAGCSGEAESFTEFFKRYSASEAGEKSSPVIRAPSRASEIVSVPMWHWRWTPSRPRTSPSSGRSKRTTSLRWAGSERNRSRA